MPDKIKIKFNKTSGMGSYNSGQLPKFKDGDEKEVTTTEAHYLLGNFPNNFKSAGKNTPKHSEVKAANDHYAKIKDSKKPTIETAEVKQRMKQLDQKEAELTKREEAIIESEEKILIDYNINVKKLADIAEKMGATAEFNKMLKDPEENK